MVRFNPANSYSELIIKPEARNMWRAACLLAFLSSALGHGHHPHQHHDHEGHEDRRQLVRKQRPHNGQLVGDSEGRPGFAGADALDVRLGRDQVKRPMIFNGKRYASSEEFGKAGMVCGTKDLTPEKREKVQKEVDAFMLEKFGERGVRHLTSEEIVINTYIHVVYKDSATDPTNVSMEAINKQMQILNHAYSGNISDYDVCYTETQPTDALNTPFRFNLVEVTRTLNNEWHNALNDQAMATALRRGTCSDLNIFINGPQDNLGYASLASSCRNFNLKDDLVAVSWQTLPDVGVSQFSEGDTATHEVGHWLGLEHTWDGGCASTSGLTPPEKSAAFGCPIGRDTCAGGGVDPIRNFMDYTDDCCMYTFTSGQIERMIGQVFTFRNLPNSPSGPGAVPSPLPGESPSISVPGPTPGIVEDPNQDDTPMITGPSSCLAGELHVNVMMSMDEYAYETSYEIMEVSTGDIVVEFQGVQAQALKMVQHRTCLDASKQYVFVIRDLFGDGMTGYNTPGYWKIKLDGTQIATGGEFAFHDLATFGGSPCPSGQAAVIILLQTDDNGAQNEWLVRDNNTNSVLGRRRRYSYLDNKLQVDLQCLDTGLQAVLLIRDWGDDGVCCAHGNGFYAVWRDKKLLDEGGAFNFVTRTWIQT